MKNIVITGATSGLGNLLVKEFSALGYKVFAGYRNLKLKTDLSAISENVIPFYIDMSKKWSVSKAAKSICEQLDEDEKIDTLIKNNKLYIFEDVFKEKDEFPPKILELIIRIENRFKEKMILIDNRYARIYELSK